MQYCEFTPHHLLKPYVRSIWSLEVDGPEEFARPLRITPDCVVEVVFHYRTPFAMSFGGEGFAPQPNCFALSQNRRFVEIRPKGPGGFVSVRFEPWGAYHFLPFPVREIADRLLPTATLWGDDATKLEQRLVSAPGAVKRVALVEQFLLAQLRRYRKADVEHLVRAVWRHNGRMRISELCRELGVGERRLERVFAAVLGLPPKSYARLCRFLSACRKLRGKSSRSLTEVGNSCGYYDQSHFIADFQALSGMTPGQFLSNADIAFLDLD